MAQSRSCIALVKLLPVKETVRTKKSQTVYGESARVNRFLVGYWFFPLVTVFRIVLPRPYCVGTVLVFQRAIYTYIPTFGDPTIHGLECERIVVLSEHMLAVYLRLFTRMGTPSNCLTWRNLTTKCVIRTCKSCSPWLKILILKNYFTSDFKEPIT